MYPSGNDPESFELIENPQEEISEESQIQMSAATHSHKNPRDPRNIKLDISQSISIDQATKIFIRLSETLGVFSIGEGLDKIKLTELVVMG